MRRCIHQRTVWTESGAAVDHPWHCRQRRSLVLLAKGGGRNGAMRRHKSLAVRQTEGRSPLQVGTYLLSRANLRLAVRPFLGRLGPTSQQGLYHIHGHHEHGLQRLGEKNRLENRRLQTVKADLYCQDRGSVLRHQERRHIEQNRLSKPYLGKHLMPSQWHKEDDQIKDWTPYQGEMMPEKTKNDQPERWVVFLCVGCWCLNPP